jgi:hypothetical protein
MPNHPKAKSNTRAKMPRQRARLYGPPPMLLGEDAAAYEELFTGIHEPVKPVDALDEMLVADVVNLQWDVMRWRRFKSALFRVCEHEALTRFLEVRLDDDLYATEFADALAINLKNHLPRDQADTAEQLAQACARNDPDAKDEVEQILPFSISEIRRLMRASKAAELAQKYVRREPDAVTLVDKILANASADIDNLSTKEVVANRIDAIEQIERLTAIVESRRNAGLRELDRRRTVVGEKLRRSVNQLEHAELQVVETTPAQGKNAA